MPIKPPLPCLVSPGPVLAAVFQANRKELLSLTDKLVAGEAEVEQLRKQSSSLQGQLDAAQAKVSQQAAALAAVQEAQSKQQVRPGVGCLVVCLAQGAALPEWPPPASAAPQMLGVWCMCLIPMHIQLDSPPPAGPLGALHPAVTPLQAKMAEASLACTSKEAECRQLQERVDKQQQQLAEAAAAAQHQAAEFDNLQVTAAVTRPLGCCCCSCFWLPSRWCWVGDNDSDNCAALLAAVLVQGELGSAQQQLADLQSQCQALAAEKTTLQQQNTDAAAAASKLREQLQQAQADTSRVQKEAESSAREASSLRVQLSQQVSAMQELQQVASGSGKELQVGVGCATCRPAATVVLLSLLCGAGGYTVL